MTTLIKNRIIISLLLLAFLISISFIIFKTNKEFNTFESGPYNFKLDYPSYLVWGFTDDKVLLNLVDEKTVLWESDKPADGLTASVLVNKENLSLDKFVDNVLESKKRYQSEFCDGCIWNKEKSLLDNHPAIKLKFSDPEWKKKQNNEEIYAEYKIKGDSFVLVLNKNNAGDDTFATDFDKIVDSFEFITD